MCVAVTSVTVKHLDQHILRWFRILTHVHTAGNSACSGQQTLAEVVATAKMLGFEGVVLSEHTGDPANPLRLSSASTELSELQIHAQAVAGFAASSEYDLRFGVECNVAESFPDYCLDTPLEALKRFDPYVIGSVHGDERPYLRPGKLMEAITMLCSHPGVDTLGHVTRNFWEATIAWQDVAQMAAQTGTAIEINLNQWFKEMGQNQPLPDNSIPARRWRRFLEDLAGTAVIPVIGSDIHNSGMWPTHAPEQGWETSVQRIEVFLELLSDCGFAPERMAGSSRSKFNLILGTPKSLRPSLV
jgi:histidinol phosphatase-like PHP family hydrolase